mgnify:CR=1 FL=1
MGVDAKVVKVLEGCFGRKALEQRARELGVVRRERKVTAVSLVLSLVTSAVSGEEKRSISSARREFEALTGQPIEESAWRKRLNAALLRLLVELLGRVLAATGRLHKFDDFEDILAGDSTTLMLPSPCGVQSSAIYPSTVDGKGGLKISTVLSLGSESLADFNFAAARYHDRRILRERVFLKKGVLGLLDMGYADHDFLAEIDGAGAFFIVPLKTTTRLTLVRARRGIPRSRTRRGTLLDGRLRYGDVVDADVQVSTSNGQRRLRAVMVRLAKRDGTVVDCWYLTNLPPTFASEAVAELYRLRWQVERFFAHGKGIARLDHITSAAPTIIFIQIVASLLAIALTRAVSIDIAHGDSEAVISPDRALKVMARFLPRIAEAILRCDGSLPRIVSGFIRVFRVEAQSPNPGRLPAIYASSQRKAA